MLRLRAGQLRRFGFSAVRFIDCHSCGVPLQDRDAGKVGYWPGKTGGKDSAVTLEDVKYLLFGQDIQKIKETVVPEGSLTNAKVEKPPVCKRCSDALYRNKYDPKDFEDVLYTELLKRVPRGSNVVHVVPITEFPFHIDLPLLKDKNFNSSVVFTKADQVFRNKVQVQKYLAPFLKKFMLRYLNIDTQKTIGISATKNWNMDTFMALLKGRTFLIGEPNSGKSTLINTLLSKFVGFKLKDKTGKKVELDEQMLADLNTNKKLFLQKQMTGVSHIPNLTREQQAFQIKEKLIFDLPGYRKDVVHEGYKLETIIHPKWLQRMRKTQLFDNKKIKKQRYASVTGSEYGKCITLGGIFYLVPPQGSINQVISFLPGELKQFHDVEKGIDTMSDALNSDHPLNKYCGLRTNLKKDDYVRYIIPPFQGTIEVVLKDLGYFKLKSTGRYEFKGLYEIWLPKGIDVCVRRPLEKIVDIFYQESQELGVNSRVFQEPLISNVYAIAHDDQSPHETLAKYAHKSNILVSDIVDSGNEEPSYSKYWTFKF